MNEQQQFNEYFNDLSNMAKEQDKARLRSLVLSFHSTLQRLPALKQELDVMLQSTEALDYEALLQRVEPVLQQASDWLLKVDLLPTEIANEPSIQENVPKFSSIMRLSTIPPLIQEFDKQLEKLNERENDPEYCYAQVHNVLEGFYSYMIDEADKPRVLKWLQKAADLGHAEAQYKLSKCYAGKWGLVKESKKQEWYWKEQAANSEHAKAQFDMGNAYCDGGDYLPEDYEKGFYWYEKSAKQGNTSAQNNLAYLYQTGEGVSKDIEKAEFWYKKTTSGGAYWRYSVGERYANGNGIPQNSKSAVFWMESAASEEDREDYQYKLAERYVKGNGIPKNIERAKYWMQEAAKNGSKEAIHWLKENR